MAAPRLSVVMITLDEAPRIERCLRSVAFADEIVVLDGASRDGTADIARALGARVQTAADWPGFGPQKNRALALATGEWVFSIDADEVVTAELAAAIRRVVAADGDGRAGWWVRRASSFCGRLVRHGDWRNDRVLRLFRRDAARFSDDLVHERVLCEGPQGELAGVLLHDSVESLEDGRAKMLRYARAGADKLRERGRGGVLDAWVHGTWTFVRGYLLRGGFLDGAAGLAIARLNARGTWLRYRWAALPQSQAAPDAAKTGATPPGVPE